MPARAATHLGILVLCAAASACARPLLEAAPGGPQSRPQSPLSELWIEPRDIAKRDLLWGPGRRDEAPTPGAVYTVTKRDTTGYSRGFDVTSADGREWDIKVGNEVQSEIAVSRILWAVGYHQPAVYYVTDWELSGAWELEGRPARFRLESDHETEGDWRWDDNPFAGTSALRGLIALNVMLNSWDFRTSNNRVYRLTDTRIEPARRYVFQDLGASLGKTRGLPFIVGTRNDVADFESDRLVQRVRGETVELDYRGPNRNAVEQLRVPDIVWACELVERLTDDQLDDAFEAAGYEPDVRQRFVTKLRAKMREGLALRTTQRASAEEE